MDDLIIRLQTRQTQFAMTPADIAIYGGAAGGGKTFSLLVEPMRHRLNKDFGAVIFRRTTPEITAEGGLWDEAGKIYPFLGAKPNEVEHQYKFNEGSRVTFSHMQLLRDRLAWKSSQIPLIEYDQLETFEEEQFFYMLSRNRSTCGVKPYIRGSVNPEPGWVAKFLDWWIAEDGYADLARSGKIRWMVRVNDVLKWANTKEELLKEYPDDLPKSVTFILSTIYDNQILLKKDPGYLANLKALPLIDRERLLGDPVRGGNWKVKPGAGKIFNRGWFKIVPLENLPAGGVVVRHWDFAATEKQLKKPDPDFTASTLMLYVNQRFFVLDCTADRLDPPKIDDYYDNITRQDQARFNREGRRYLSRWEVEPGSAGIREAWRLTTRMAGIDAQGIGTLGKDKIARSKGYSAQVEAGNVYVVDAPWNDEYLTQMHGFNDLPHDDIPDSSDGAFMDLLDNTYDDTPQEENKSPLMELIHGRR
jgi:predicted phage terminase large subunit-like protein